LEGYLILSREDEPGIGLKRSRIIDLFVANDDAETIDALLDAAYESSREQGCHVLESAGLPPDIGNLLFRRRPFTRTFPNYPYFHKPLAPELERRLAPEAAWYLTMYDGDSSL